MFSFIETKLFTRLIQEYLTDDEYRNLQRVLMEDPDAGKVIPDSGGVRKLRWRALGRGERGGYRVIYFRRTDENIFWMLTMYPKNVADDISAATLRKIRQEIEDEEGTKKRRR